MLVGVGEASYGRGAQWKNAFILRVFIACHRIYATPRSEVMAGNMLNGIFVEITPDEPFSYVRTPCYGDLPFDDQAFLLSKCS